MRIEEGSDMYRRLAGQRRRDIAIRVSAARVVAPKVLSGMVGGGMICC